MLWCSQLKGFEKVKFASADIYLDPIDDLLIGTMSDLRIPMPCMFISIFQ